MKKECAICSKLADKEYAMRKYLAEDNTFLPKAILRQGGTQSGRRLLRTIA